jgi:hypothetical protein
LKCLAIEIVLIFINIINHRFSVGNLISELEAIVILADYWLHFLLIECQEVFAVIAAACSSVTLFNVFAAISAAC